MDNKLIHSFTHLLIHMSWGLLLSCSWLWRHMSLIFHLKINPILLSILQLLNCSHQAEGLAWRFSILFWIAPTSQVADIKSNFENAKTSFSFKSAALDGRKDVFFLSCAKQTVLRAPERGKERGICKSPLYLKSLHPWFKPLNIPKNTLKTPRIGVKCLKLVLTAKMATGEKKLTTIYFHQLGSFLSLPLISSMFWWTNLRLLSPEFSS